MNRIVSQYNFDYLMKADDDTYINVTAIQNEINTFNKSERIWWGK